MIGGMLISRGDVKRKQCTEDLNRATDINESRKTDTHGSPKVGGKERKETKFKYHSNEQKKSTVRMYIHGQIGGSGKDSVATHHPNKPNKSIYSDTGEMKCQGGHFFLSFFFYQDFSLVRLSV
jgi:hypothetical protein